MTPKPAADHPDVEKLDRYADGGATDREVAAHVARCEDCREVVDALLRLRVDLACLGPVPMPDDVAARIGAALRAEQPTASAQAGEIPTSAVGRTPHRRRWGDGRFHRPAAAWLALAAAAVVAAVVIGVGVLSSEDRTDSETAAPAMSVPAPSAALVAASDAVVTPATVAQQARDLVAGRTRVIGTLRNDTYSPSDLGRSDRANGPRSMAGEVDMVPPVGSDLQLCYVTFAGRTGGRVLGVDRIRFDGHPAVSVVLSVPADLQHLRVLVVDPGCTATSADGSIRYQAVVPRG